MVGGVYFFSCRDLKNESREKANTLCAHAKLSIRVMNKIRICLFLCIRFSGKMQLSSVLTECSATIMWLILGVLAFKHSSIT